MLIGRFFWEPDYPTPWMSFKNITEFRKWRRDINKELNKKPRVKFEYAYVDLIWTADSMLKYIKAGAK